MAPVLRTVPSGVELVIVPDRCLGRLPFAALRNAKTQRFLVQDHPLSTTLGLHFFLRSGREEERGKHRLRRILLVGDPDPTSSSIQGLGRLAGAKEEVRTLAHLYPSADVLTGPWAKKDVVLKILPHADVFHYAGHGEFNPERPWASYLPLARDKGSESDSGILYRHDILSLHRGILRVVVLSACRSGERTASRSSGLTGIASSFLAIGVPNVVSSLWDIDDRTAGEVLVEFHRILLAGESPATALQRAQIDEIAKVSLPCSGLGIICSVPRSG